MCKVGTSTAPLVLPMEPLRVTLQDKLQETSVFPTVPSPMTRRQCAYVVWLKESARQSKLESAAGAGVQLEQLLMMASPTIIRTRSGAAANPDIMFENEVQFTCYASQRKSLDAHDGQRCTHAGQQLLHKHRVTADHPAAAVCSVHRTHC